MEALNHYVLSLAPACWVSDRPRGSPGASVTGERRPNLPWETRSPSARKHKKCVTLWKEIQPVGCSQLWLLDKFLSFCHFYKNT